MPITDGYVGHQTIQRTSLSTQVRLDTDSTAHRPPQFNVRAAARVRELNLANAGEGSQSVTHRNVSIRFGQRLRQLRCSRGMTQEYMAKKFGIDRSFISDVERGRKSMSLSTLEVLAIGLGITLSDLFANL